MLKKIFKKNDDDENKFRCPDYFTERSLRSSSCQIILENPSGKCENLNEYAECLQNEMDRKYNFDCSLEGVKQRLVESSMGFIKFIAGEELQKNCFGKFLILLLVKTRLSRIVY